jgi:hypothetical protein
VKLELLTNATVVDDAIRFVTEKGEAVVASAEPKTDIPAIKEEEQLESIEQESYNNATNTINQVF